MDKHNFGDKFLQYLGRTDYSQAWLARKLGVHRSTVNKWITGENQIPPEKLQECCELFGLDERERFELFTFAGYKALLAQISGFDQPFAAEQKAYDAILYVEPGNFRKPDQLYGRHPLLVDIHALLDQGKHILLTGLGGTGKTALAATIADERIERGRGPVLWLVSGGADNPDIFFDALLAPLGGQQELGMRKGDARIYVIKRILAQSAVKLIILDDFRKAELLPQIRLALPSSIPLLITSRQDWANVDESIKVTNLTPVEAVELLAARARNTSYHHLDYRNDFDARLLCEKLEHHPLAIVIAGAWLRQNKRRAGSLLVRLDSADGAALTLTMPPGFGEKGHESVAVMLDETFQALATETQTVFRAIGALFQPYMTAKFLAMYIRKDKLQVEDALDELMAWNFVEREHNDFYSLHDMLHSYAHMLYLKSGKPSRAQLIAAVQQYTQTYALNIEELHANLPNILQTAEVADDEPCWIIISSLALEGYQDNYGHRLDYLILLDRVLRFIETKRNSGRLTLEQLHQLHHLLCKRGNAYFDRGEQIQAIETYQRALTWAYNSERQIKSLGLIGKCFAFNHDLESAQHYFSQAYKLVQETQDHVGLSFMLEQEAHAAGFLEDYETARRVAAEQVLLSERFLQVEQNRTLQEALFYALNNLGMAELRLAQKPLPEVIEIHHRAEQIALQLQSPDFKALVFWSLAEDYHTLGNRDKAADYLHEAYRLYKIQHKSRDEQVVSTFMREHGYRQGLSE